MSISMQFLEDNTLYFHKHGYKYSYVRTIKVEELCCRLILYAAPDSLTHKAPNGLG